MKLFIIGNGFDINHGYKTDYLTFRKYIYSHKHPILGFDLSDYFSDDSDDLWSDFENNLEFIDFEEQTDFFVGSLNQEEMSDREWERECSRRSALHDSFTEAPKTIFPALCTALSNFICEEYKKKTPAPKNYFSKLFNTDDIFITFNYTKTLEDIYKIKNNNVKHIHGLAYPSYKSKDNLNEFYEDPNIIFGHANTKKIKYDENEDDLDNEIISNRCLKNMNKELEKSYQISSFIDFISDKSIELVEIIGHDIGPVDDPYFDLLNDNIERRIPINYWLYDTKKEKEKKQKLSELFPGHTITIKYY